ncbi:MAG TPA: RNA polymerase sigma-70 factor [Yeosuana sp.]
MKSNNNDLLHFNNFKKGEELAFEYFFNHYYNKILGFCVQFLYDDDEAKSITQESFLNLWLNRENITTINGISSFLYTYAKSKCLNAIRHQKVKEKFKTDILNEKERALDIEILKSMNFDTLALTELEELIHQSIQELPEKTKSVFLKKRFENKNNQEIAYELNMSVKSVEAYMTKALKVMKDKLSDYLPVILFTVILK